VVAEIEERLMLAQILSGALVSFLNFGVHAFLTGVIVVITNHIAGATDDLHVFMRLTALLLVTVSALMIAHLIEIGIWAAFIALVAIPLPQIEAFEFAFENYVALGYGDVVAGAGWRLIGPIISLNGLLLIGWSVAVIFEVMKMADVQIRRRDKDEL
jgi:hypothetical protein